MEKFIFHTVILDKIRISGIKQCQVPRFQWLDTQSLLLNFKYAYWPEAKCSPHTRDITILKTLKEGGGAGGGGRIHGSIMLKSY